MLLPTRSIFIKVCVISIFITNGQSYKYDHDIESYDGDDDPSRVDYSKYFNKDHSTAASQPTGAFVDPVKDPFQSFFFQSPIGFNAEAAKFTAESNKKEVFSPFDHLHAVRQSIVGDGKASASNDNPLTTDFFEAAQRNLQAEDDDVIRPGPHYVSHQVPVPKSLFREAQKAHESRDDVETIRPPVKSKSTKDDDGYDGFNAYDVYESIKNGHGSKPETYLYGTGKDVDYNTGKSSSTVSQYPAASGLNAVLKGLPTTTVSSNEKYNFETTPIALQTKYLETLVSTTSAPEIKPVFEPEIEGISEAASNNCRRIASPEQAEDMNCFVCQDGKAKYTQCSYSSDDDGSESRIHFSTPIRLKRSPRRGNYNDDPYIAARERSRKAFEDFEKDHAAAESERQKDFHYVPWSPEEAESYSDEQAAEAIKDAGNDCKKVEKDGVTCTVCKNPKTGGNFESCSYASAPKEHKYAYVAEKKYDSNDEPIEKEGSASEKQEKSEPQDESKVSELKVEATEAVPAITAYPVDRPFPELVGAGTIVHEESGSENDDEEIENDYDKPESNSNDEEDKKPETESDDEAVDDKKEESASDDEPSYYNFNYDDDEKNEEASEKKENTKGEDDWDSYHYKIFPEFSKGSEESETQNAENKAPPPEKQDVEEVLAEFAKKDRSNCKKAEKNGMTCFLCVDKNKVQHEECMFIQESKPKATHVAYHELQRLKDPKKEEPAESKIEKVTQQPLAKPNDLPSSKTNPLAQTDSFPSPSNKKKIFFKKVNAQTAPELAVAASESLGTWVAFDQPKKHFVKRVSRDLHEAASAPDSERIEGGSGYDRYGEEKDEKETSASNSNSEKVSDEERKREEAADNAPRPKEIDVEENEGAFSHETKPVYSKLYGTTLPKYMVEKTDFEKDFDAAAGFD